MSALPWGALLAAAARMGLRPADFWGVSLKEWRLMMENSGSAPVMGRGELEGLLSRYPDGEDHG